MVSWDTGLSAKIRTIPGKPGQVVCPRSRPSSLPFFWTDSVASQLASLVSPVCLRSAFYTSAQVIFLNRTGTCHLVLKTLRHSPFSIAEGQRNSSVSHSLAPLPLRPQLWPPAGPYTVIVRSVPADTPLGLGPTWALLGQKPQSSLLFPIFLS